MINGDFCIELALTQHRDVPAVVGLTLIEHSRRHFVALNIERAAELMTVLGHAVSLVGRPNG